MLIKDELTDKEKVDILENRLRYLLKSEVVQLYDEKIKFTNFYKYSIQELNNRFLGKNNSIIKQAFKVIQDTFNNKYVKALYITISIEIIFTCLLLLANIAPFIMLIVTLLIALILVYKAVLKIIE